MSVLWFIIAVTFFILWLNGKSKQPGSSGANSSYDYARGYWDGYRALCDELLDRIKTGVIDTPLINKLRDKSYTPEPADVAEEPAPSRVTDDTVLDVEPPTLSATTPVAPQPQLTAKDIQAAAEQRTLRNLNILLYVGSFLIVAAAALFVTFIMPAIVKLVGLMFVTAAFYLSGLLLHTHSVRLKPAALAFVGTGLAMIPFIGFALASLGGLSGASAWFITSLVGLVAYFVAAIRLQSEFISYITMAFVLSLSLSAISTLSLSIVWYFIVVIGVSLICNSAHILWPTRIPRSFAAPIELTSTITTPIALVASLLVGDRMELTMYEVLFGIATAHYLVVWLEKHSFVYETVVRALAHITLLIVALDLSGFNTTLSHTIMVFGFWWLALALIQATYSLLRVMHTAAEHNQIERLWVSFSIIAMTFGMMFWIGDHQALLCSLSIMLIGISALGALLRYREAGWAYVTLGASIVLPFVIGRGFFNPAVSYEAIALCFAALTPLMLVAYDRMASDGRSQAVKNVFLIAALCYGLLIALTGLLSHTATTIGWTTLLSAATLVTLSYLLRSYVLEIFGALLGIGSVIAWVYAAPIESTWQTIAWMTASTALLLAYSIVHHLRREFQRRDSLISLAIGATGLLVVAPAPTAATAQTVTVLLIAAGVASLAVRFIQRSSTSPLTTIARIGTCLFPLLSILTAWHAGHLSHGWVTLALTVATGIAWLASSREKQPMLLAIGNIFLVAALATGWWWLDFSPYWAMHGVTWLAAAIFYAIYWFMVDKKDRERQAISLISTGVMLGTGALTGLYVLPQDPVAMASVGSLLAGAAVLAIHGYREHQRTLIEIAVYLATFGLQRFVSILIPDISFVFYCHWWALIIGLMAAWRSHNRQARAMIALGFVTGSSGLYALQESSYALFFLVEHSIILVAGAVLRQQWALWWGVVSVILAVLYFLRDYTFLALLFLGFLIILFVIWRLTKVAKK